MRSLHDVIGADLQQDDLKLLFLCFRQVFQGVSHFSVIYAFVLNVRLREVGAEPSRNQGFRIFNTCSSTRTVAEDKNAWQAAAGVSFVAATLF